MNSESAYLPLPFIYTNYLSSDIELYAITILQSGISIPSSATFVVTNTLMSCLLNFSSVFLGSKSGSNSLIPFKYV